MHRKIVDFRYCSIIIAARKNMAQRRMFSLKVIDTDSFLDMSPTAQLLYFHLAMRADDDGFVASPKKILKMSNAGEDDMKVLITKKYVIPFESGVCVIKDWKIHNYIQSDRYQETEYKDEKKLLVENNGKYELETQCIQNVSKMDTQVRLGKVSIGKDNNTSEQSSQVSELIDAFKVVNPSYKKFFGNKTQRAACQRLLKIKDLESLKKIVSFLPRSNSTQYMPVVTTPMQLEDKMGQLAAAWQKQKNKDHIIL